VFKHLQSLSSAGQRLSDQQRGKDYRLDDELIRLGHLCSTQLSHLVVPSQDALSPSLSCIESGPDDAIFPSAVPKIKAIDMTVSILVSKQAPVKMALISNQGQKVHFLLKPTIAMARGASLDDYRKDAYMMDFCALLNRLFERSPDARSRELSLRTYAVIIVTQNVGMMEWVNNSLTIRNIMLKLYEEHRSTVDPRFPSHRTMAEKLAEMQKPNFDKPSQESLKTLKEQYCTYFDRIPVLLYKWFLKTFQSPNEWFSARLNFVRSMAVWSIVGYITGLGDRHADNILMHVKSGGCFHVDFECLLDHGSSLTVPERVPFRLTPNLVDVMGPSGEEGAFRTCCVVTMKVLREHRAGLISVSELFTNDPLIKWNDSNQELRKENLKVCFLFF
jgi:serine/threonine-protein kinase ATR